MRAQTTWFWKSRDVWSGVSFLLLSLFNEPDFSLPLVLEKLGVQSKKKNSPLCQQHTYRSRLRFRNSFVFTTRPPRDAAPSCNSCPSRPQGRRHICQCARSAGSRWVPQCERALQLQCSLALRRCATAAKHVWTSRTALLRCSRLAARSRPTTRSTRGSWRGLTHDLCYPSAGPAAVSQRASFLAPSC